MTLEEARVRAHANGYARAFERIAKRIEIAADGCWLWRGHTQRHGYGQVWFRGQARWVHRVMFTIVHGREIRRYRRKTMHIDHQCFVHRCVCPDHLQERTPRKNSGRHRPKERAA